jgi:LysR family transcriptional regulator, glycine cleavage system transcriptional activator
MPGLPPLNALRAFEAASRHLSFKRAAEELCVTQGAVSRHILRLETALGVRLFVRHHRQVELTLAGSAYGGEVRNAFLAIERATATLTLSDSQTLRIRVPPTCAIRWFVPRLPRFSALHPDIAVLVTTSHEAVDFDHEDIDVGLQYGRSNGPHLVCEALFQEMMIPVCTREVAEKGKGIHTPRDLAAHVLLKSVRRMPDWPRWFEAAGFSDDTLWRRELVLENASLTYEGAEKGLGVAMAQAAFVQDELNSGRLVRPLPQTLVTDTGYYLVFPEEKTRFSKVRVFRAWLATEAAALREALSLA